MKYKIKVTEYGIENKYRKIHPEYYSWDYCIEMKIPYIIITPRIKFSTISYDLFTVDNGLMFPDDNKLIDYWWKIYEEYVVDFSFPKSKIPNRIIGEVTDFFTVYKADQFYIIDKLLKEIEYFTNKYAILDYKRKKHFEEIRITNENVKRFISKK